LFFVAEFVAVHVEVAGKKDAVTEFRRMLDQIREDDIIRRDVSDISFDTHKETTREVP
jgi:hypothetical protein